jgi:hypothetical protein
MIRKRLLYQIGGAAFYFTRHEHVINAQGWNLAGIAFSKTKT